MTYKINPKPSNLKFCLFNMICEMSVINVIFGSKIYCSYYYNLSQVISIDGSKFLFPKDLWISITNIGSFIGNKCILIMQKNNVRLGFQYQIVLGQRINITPYIEIESIHVMKSRLRYETVGLGLGYRL